jgi:hypothetical protein
MNTLIVLGIVVTVLRPVFLIAGVHGVPLLIYKDLAHIFVGVVAASLYYEGTAASSGSAHWPNLPAERRALHLLSFSRPPKTCLPYVLRPK